MKGFAILFLMAAVFTASGLVHGSAAARGTEECLECHYRLPFPGSRLSFNEGVADVCGRCHVHHHGKNERNSHPVDAVPSMPIPRDMPLDIKGSLTCVTCHSFHRGHDRPARNFGYFLRRLSGKTFCYSCHKTRLF